MSVGLDLAQLNAIACASIAVNEAASGASGYAVTGDYMPDLITIACQMRNANVALGGSGGGAGGFDSVGNLMVYITCQAQGMASATGTGSAMPWQPYNMLQMWQAIDCALAQTITNIGGDTVGYSNNSVFNLMSGAICLMAEIAEHGFTPGDAFFILLNDSSGKVLLNDGSFALQNSAP